MNLALPQVVIQHPPVPNTTACLFFVLKHFFHQIMQIQDNQNIVNLYQFWLIVLVKIKTNSNISKWFILTLMKQLTLIFGGLGSQGDLGTKTTGGRDGGGPSFITFMAVVRALNKVVRDCDSNPHSQFLL